MRLSHRDLTALITALPELYVQASPEEIPRKMLQTVSSLVSCFAATYDEWDVDSTGQVRGWRVEQSRPIPEVEAIVSQLPSVIHTHPLFPTLQRRVTQPLKISDFATPSQFQRTEAYNQVYRHLDVQHQMAWFLPGHVSPHICLVMSRQRRDFSERDRQMLSLLSPHLRQAHNNALALAKSASAPASLHPNTAAQSRWEVVRVSADGRPQSPSGRAVEWLEKYFEGAAWPETLQRWLKQQTWVMQPDESALLRGRPLIRERPDGRLDLRFLPGRDGAGMLLLNETSTLPLTSDKLRTLPLTSREREVFRWICEGKTNPEIAGILNISRRTVDKHIEHLLGKLGLENRFQIQRLGWDLCGH